MLTSLSRAFLSSLRSFIPMFFASLPFMIDKAMVECVVGWRFYFIFRGLSAFYGA